MIATSIANPNSPVNDENMDTLTCEHWTDRADWRLRSVTIKPNSNWVKPTGALWVSPVHSVWRWQDWCLQNEYRRGPVRVILQVNLAHFIKIEKYADLDKLTWYKNPQNATFWPEYPDFYGMAEAGIAGIWLTERGEWATRPLVPHRRSFNGWDCESLAILNADCVLSWCIDPTTKGD